MIDLKFNYPSLPDEGVYIKEWMATQPDPTAWLPFPPIAGSDSLRVVSAKWLRVHPDVSDVVMANSGNHAITCVLDMLSSIATGIITDPFTYPAFRHSALRKKIQMHAAAVDNEGLTPTGIEEAITRSKANVLYLQPTLHNPTCAVMSLARRSAIADIVKRNNMLVIEDDAYRFLHPDPPPSFLDILPSRTIHIYSLSKPFNPLLKTTMIALPREHTAEMINSIRLTSSGNSSLMNAMAEHFITTGIIDNLIEMKRTHARNLQQRVLPALEGVSFQTHPNAFHLWIQLMNGITSSEISSRLGAANILIPSGTDFETVPNGTGEGYIRVALAAERDERKLVEALRQVSGVSRSSKT